MKIVVDNRQRFGYNVYKVNEQRKAHNVYIELATLGVRKFLKPRQRKAARRPPRSTVDLYLRSALTSRKVLGVQYISKSTPHCASSIRDT